MSLQPYIYLRTVSVSCNPKPLAVMALQGSLYPSCSTISNAYTRFDNHSHNITKPSTLCPTTEPYPQTACKRAERVTHETGTIAYHLCAVAIRSRVQRHGWPTAADYSQWAGHEVPLHSANAAGALKPCQADRPVENRRPGQPGLVRGWLIDSKGVHHGFWGASRF